MAEDKREAARRKEAANVFGMLPLDEQVQAPIVKFMKVATSIIDGPTTWVRENIVEKFRGAPYPYYHRKYKRVPTVDECHTDDFACVYEADVQYKRDRQVDFEIIKILKQRYHLCSFYERPANEWVDHDKVCLKEKDDLLKAEMNLFIKYGELGPYTSALHAFMKQKHRLIFERRQREKASKLPPVQGE